MKLKTDISVTRGKINRSRCTIPMIIVVLIALAQFHLDKHTYNTSIILATQESHLLGDRSPRNIRKRVCRGKLYKSNLRFSIICIAQLLVTVAITWHYVMLTQSGDIHPNPGPLSSSPNSTLSSSINSSFSSMGATNLSNHFSFVHYNVQSIRNKLDLLQAELNDFESTCLLRNLA